jgi:DNA polymerase I-like protein with 3'-5' exonuclease and polymerase domains
VKDELIFWLLAFFKLKSRASAALLKSLSPRLCQIDEIILECPEDFLADAERVLKDTMVRACRDFLKLVAIPEPEVLIARSWIKQ